MTLAAHPCPDHALPPSPYRPSRLARAALLGCLLAGNAPLVGAASAQSLDVNGAGVQRDLRCDGQDVEIAGLNHRVTLVGACGTVTVQGSGHQVTLASAQRLLVYGRAHVVAASASVGGLEVAGTEHDIRAGIAPGDAAIPAEVSLSGLGTRLRLRLLGPVRIEVAGAQQQVLWAKAEGVPDPDGSAVGRNNIIRRDDTGG